MVTILILTLLTGAAVTLLRPDTWQAERDEALASLGQLSRLQDAQVLATSAPADTARLAELMPEMSWLGWSGTEPASTGPTAVAVTVSGSTVLGAAQFGEDGCALLRREYSPGPAVAPVTWAVRRPVPACVPSLAAALLPSAGRGLLPTSPLVIG